MTYYADLTREIAMICLSMSLGGAEGFVDKVEVSKLSKTEYIAVLAASAVRIGGCANYDPSAAFAAASRMTERALATYDATSGDQTLDLMGLMTKYMRYPNESSPQGDTAQLEVFEVWINTWAKAEAQIDPSWSPQAAFPSFDDSRVMNGQTADGIQDPQLKAKYEKHLADKDVFLKRNRDQTLLRRALEQYGSHFVRYAEDLRKVPNSAEALQSLAGRVTSSSLAAALTK